MRVRWWGLLAVVLMAMFALWALAAGTLAAGDYVDDLGLGLVYMFGASAAFALAKALDRKGRQEAADDIRASAEREKRARNVPPELCQLCAGDAGRVKCASHNLLICIPCLANHDPERKCTMYLTPGYEAAMKARA